MPYPQLSIICPAYNESENIHQLYEELMEVLESLTVPFELILVDDGSTDDTKAQIVRLMNTDKQVKGFFLGQNRGQSFAMKRGIDQAKGDILVFIDADLQNVPADIPSLLKKMEEGYDLVCGWRKTRQDSLITTTLPSKMGNWLIRSLFGVPLHDTGCTLKAVKAPFAKEIKYFNNFHRYIPVILSQKGARMSEVVVQHRPRIHGQSKYSVFKVTGVLKELFYLKFFY